MQAWIMAPPQAIQILGQMEDTSVQVSTYGLLVGAISGQGFQAWLQYLSMG